MVFCKACNGTVSFLDILKAVDSKKSFVRTLVEFMRPETVASLKRCDGAAVLNFPDSEKIDSKSGTSYVVKTADYVYLPCQDRTVFGIAEVIPSFNSFCLLSKEGVAAFIGDQEDFDGFDREEFIEENVEILEVFSTMHSYCLVKWDRILLVGNPCFGGLYRSKRKENKYSSKVTYSRGVIGCKVTGKFSNRFKIRYKSTRSHGGSHEIGCAKLCKGGHLKSFYE